MKNALYTVGYTAFDRERLLDVLIELGIHCLVDVRSVPMSAHAPEYNRPDMELALRAKHIYYRNYQAFGARQPDRSYYTDEGWLDFDLYAKSSVFLEAVQKIYEGMNAGYRFALMCAEKDPVNCHRAILVARRFHQDGIDVEHILGADNEIVRLESHGSLENRMMRLNGDDIRQVSMFDSDEVRLQNAYRRQNREIGYRMEAELL